MWALPTLSACFGDKGYEKFPLHLFFTGSELQVWCASLSLLLQEPAAVPVPCCASNRTPPHLHGQAHAPSSGWHRRADFSWVVLQAEVHSRIGLHFQMMNFEDAYVHLYTTYTCTCKLPITSAQDWYPGERKGAWWHMTQGLCSGTTWVGDV